MATAKTITAFKYRTEVIADITKHTSEFKKADETVEKYGKTVQKVGKETAKAFDGQAVGKKWGSDFGSSAVASITGSIGSIGQTIGALIGTGIAPGIGTAIGSTIGSGIDTALQKVSGPILEQITSGIELNKLLERSRIHFTTFVGDEKEAVAHLEDLKKLSGDTGLRMGVLVQGSQRLEEFTSKLDLTRLFMRAAADQSAKFYGDATVGFDSMSDALGRIMLRGEDVGKLMKQLEGQGVHWKQYLAEGLGLSEKQAAALVKAGRIKGEGIATLVAQGIERHAGGFAQMNATVGPGVEQRAGSLMEIRAAEGTEKITGGIGDAYRKFAELLASPEAKKVVDFIDKMGGYVVDFTESAVKKAVSVGGGIAEGIMNFNPSSMTQSFSKLAGFVDTGLKTVFEIQSPSERSARVIGEPVGHGVGVGMVRKFKGFIQGPGKDEIVATLEELLKDPQIARFLELISKSETGKGLMSSAGRLFGPLGSVANPGQYGSATAGWAGARVFSPSLHKWVMTHPIGGLQIEPGTARSFSRATGQNLPMDVHTQELIGAWLITQTRGALQKIQSGDFEGAMGSLGGTWESFKTYNRPGTASAANLIASVAGKPIDASNPMPVRMVGAQGQYLDNLQSFTQQNLANFKAQSGSDGTSTSAGRWAGYAAVGTELVPGYDPSRHLLVLGEEQAAIISVTDASKELITTATLTAEQMTGMGITLHKLTAPIIDVTDSSRAAYATNADIQKRNRDLYIANASLGQELVGAFQSISGMIPGQQTVSKKRGLFSKILGFAAPFLAFIPGVGPILSAIAGAGSNIAGGNYGAAVSGIAGGFATGGVFRSSGGVGAAPKPAKGSAGRAMGGPVYADTPYIVGEHRPELFVPNQNGRIIPEVPGGSSAALASAVSRLHALLSRLESMPAHEIVRLGANGLTRAMDSDAGLANRMGRRLNFT
jgi:hypothetical protein